MANEMENGNLKALNELKSAIEKSNRIVVLTGAGASVPSGIPTFAVRTACMPRPLENILPKRLSRTTFS